jgi:plastocyanin
MNNNIILGIVVVLALIVVFGFFFLGPIMSLFSGIGGDTSGAEDRNLPPANPPTSPSLEEMQGARNNTSSTGGDTLTTPPPPAQTNTPASPATASNVTVTYTDSGFSPKSVTVKRGQSVTFINQSSRSMWVGADDHPTHTKYPVKSAGDCLGSSFDSCKGSGSGQSWSFTFTETGSWGYHNHTRAADRGTVVVQ